MNQTIRLSEIFSDDLFIQNNFKASLSLIIGLLFYGFSIFVSLKVLENRLYVLIPLIWFLIGTAQMSLFVIGHDCAHRSFFRSKLLNNVVGHLCMVPAFYPFYGWLYSHNAHHQHTNQLNINTDNIYYDNAWTPLTLNAFKELRQQGNYKKIFLYKLARYFPPFGSMLHNLFNHFYIKKFKKTQRLNVMISYVVLYSSFFIMNLVLFFIFHQASFNFHIFFAPILFFHFWMALYTFQHHTAQNIKLFTKDNWNFFEGQLLGTYNSISPAIISIVHFNIDVHIPHHLSSAIPSYKLAQANESIKKSKYIKWMKESKLSFRYYLRQIQNCHLWDENKECYIKFSQASF